MKQIKILLIDDEQSVFDIVSHYCKKNNDYNIELEWYDSVPDDSSIISINNFELLILDYHINGLTGIDLLKKMNNQQTQNGELLLLPVVMLSHSDDIQVASEAIHYGIYEFIQKSNLTSDLLNKTISNVIEKYNLRHELIKKNNQLIHNNEILKKQNEEISNFYQVISHELKTPLTSINEFINIILDGIAGDLTNEQQDYLTVCKKNCFQLSQYINDLLDIASASSGKLKIHKSKINLQEVVLQAIKTSESFAKKKNITLQSGFFDKNIFIFADETRICQTLLILLNNAIKFCSNNGSVKIQTTINSNKDKIQISVIDDGCGIEEIDIDKIFDRLYQVKEQRSGSNNGLGLGLFICKEIIKLHDGDIHVQSTPGKGSKFTLEFPYNSYTNEAFNEKNTYS